MAQIAGGLDVEPKLGALFKKFTEFEGHFRSHAFAKWSQLVMWIRVLRVDQFAYEVGAPEAFVRQKSKEKSQNSLNFRHPDSLGN